MLLLYIQIFIFFLGLGLLGYGRNTTLPTYVSDKCLRQIHWSSTPELILFLGLSRILPGDIILYATSFLAFLIGVHFSSASVGLLTAIIATIGLSLSSLLKNYCLSYKKIKLFINHKLNKHFHCLLNKILPGLSLSAFFLLLPIDCWHTINMMSWKFGISGYLFLSTIIGVIFFRINATFMILLCGFAGWLLF